MKNEPVGTFGRSGNLAESPLSISFVGINFSPEKTGIAPYTAGMARALTRRGHRVSVFTTYPHYPEWRFEGQPGWSSTETDHGVSVHRFRHRLPGSSRMLSRAFSEATFGMRTVLGCREQADVVVAVSPALVSSAMTLGALGLRRSRPATGLWVQDLYALGVSETGSGGRLAANVAERLENLALRGADGVAVIHQRFRDRVIAQAGVTQDRVAVIRNWTHVSASRTVDTSGVRCARGWGTEEFVVVHAGNMGAKQALGSVIEAGRVAAARGLPVRLVLVGDGNQRTKLESLAGGVDRVEFVGMVSDSEFGELLRAADALLVNERATLSDMAVPSKLTSYFASGRPVIAATDDTSVTADEIRSSRAGIVVAPEDPEALLSAIIELRNDPGRRGRMGSAGLEYCQAVLSETSAVDAFETWVAGLARRHASC